MKILVLNCGSSSIKYKLFEMPSKEVLAQGGIEKIGLPDSFLKLTLPNGEKKIIERSIQEHTSGVQMIFDVLTDAEFGVVKDLSEIEAVGHRVLHGGSKFSESVVINQDVINAIEECCDLGPLHNPANLKGIYAVQKLMPQVPQIAVFDTAFHQTMPEHAYLYPVPYELYEKYGVRRYGFHGTSHRYVSKRVCEYLNIPVEGSKIITCHIGNGGSIAAIKDGKCIDTSMGMTPLEGLMMGTRSGDIDAGAVLYIMKKEGLTPDQTSDLLNKKSGVLGMFKRSSDMRELEDAVANGEDLAIRTENMYFYRITKYIGAYAAAMGGVDVILFTGGVGENQATARAGVCKTLGFLGVELDMEKNKVRSKEAIISTENSKVTVCVIPTDEELMIATDTMELLKK
ncbi:acetate kinase [Bacteroides sp. OF04-15BH]|uniref:acetate kinase n=1 Tax=Bacteroides sp. OF04-15BH TaxID=2292281 RepID=UPI000E50FCC8|nr:acetate kinase [Bacteroides sp. OF04-15BH]RHP61827.1 acetate kinase [Bacteroides sp. OF04-15BH]